MKYFKRSEFKCPCCGLENTSDSHLAMLDDAREIAGVPFVISSGCRCVEHNKEVGGKIGSEHLTGHGTDIVADNSHHRLRIVIGLLGAGFRRIGIGKDFIHAGSSILLPSEVMWLYYTEE